ncbi:uncharacterized protein V1516DRAFT_683413 [Lipomyces oligophaga]|uniref:uncharacterized protein n=1 Tax=Lipomyces oligophaga TaxID=45792 RepID=UPI0034CFC6EC
MSSLAAPYAHPIHASSKQDATSQSSAVSLSNTQNPASIPSQSSLEMSISPPSSASISASVAAQMHPHSTYQISSQSNNSLHSAANQLSLTSTGSYPGTFDSPTATMQSQGTTPPPPSQQSSTSNIYTAVYSGIPVYEMMVNSVAVMRRRSDSYLNATQILKVGGVDKGRRTKILEKEIHTGEHEKVQGGYGKYQGTWIPFERGREFCRQYSVEDILSPLLDFDPAAPQSEQTPTKEQAMAARRKQMYAVAFATNQMSASLITQANSLASPLSTSATAALASINTTSPPSATSATQHIQSAPVPVTSEPRGTLSASSALATSFADTEADENEDLSESHPRPADDDGPPRKRTRTFTEGSIASNSTAAVSPSNDINKTNPDSSGVGGADQEDSQLSDSQEQPLDPLDQNSISNYEQSRQIMTQIFMTNETVGVSQISMLNNESMPHVDVDVAIDDLGHASLHWAAALARVQLVRDLISHDADARRGNYAGETALIRAVTVTNNLDQSSFPQLLDLLYPAIMLRDKSGRTVLHHIALTAGIKGRAAASRYYLECLLEWIVRHRPSAQDDQKVGLSRFMSEVVNAQDKNGDTCLNIAVRVGNKAIVQQLLDVGADATIPNRAGLRPVDFGITPSGADDNTVLIPPPTSLSKSVSSIVSPAVVQKSKDILAAMTAMISSLDKDFREELQMKQNALDAMHSRLREASIILSRGRARTDKLRKQSNKINELNQRDRNLENAVRQETERLRREETTEVPDDSGDVTMEDLDRIDKPVQRRALPIPNNSVIIDADAQFRLGIELENNYTRKNLPQRLTVQDKHDSASIESNSILNGNSEMDPSRSSEVSLPACQIVGPLPSIPVLRARITAYKRNRIQLQELANILRSRSSEVEDKFRGVVAKCTDVPKERVDSLLEGLVQAVQSDPGDVDMVRVAGFLRNVDEAV